MKAYYENIMLLDGLRVLSAHSGADLTRVLEIIGGDVELTLYFYDKLSSGWLEVLDGAGEFAGLGKEEAGVVEHIKALYIAECADSKPEMVLEIIKKVKAKDWAIQGALLKAVVKMPENIAVLTTSAVIEYLAEHKPMQWYYLGERSAELMVKLVGNHPDKAFELAEALLGAWVSEDGSYFKDMVAKFSGRDYKKLVLEYYRRVWDLEPGRAIEVLLKILNRCLETLDKDGKGEEGYDASKSFGYGLDLVDLNEIDMKHPRIRTILVKGICEAGRVLIDKEPGKVSEFLDMLEGTGRAIFLRIAMYLLRFVKPGTESARISKFIGDEKYYLYGGPYWYEHRRLLNDKYDDVSNEAITAFFGWVERQDIDDLENWEDWFKRVNEREPTEKDKEKYVAREKARELYLCSERFKDIYERYKTAAGVKSDSELAPRKMVSDARWVSPTEGAPLSREAMAKMGCDAVLDYILEPKNYEGKEKVSGWGTAKDALAETFRYDVKKRVDDYLECNAEKLVKLGAHFLSRFFYAFSEAVGASEFNRQEWGPILDLACEVVEQNGINEEYRTCYSAILSVLRDGFSNKEDEGIEFNEDRVKQFWRIIEALINYPVGCINQSEEHERDPVQTGCNLVPGQASELSVSLVVVCKKRFGRLYEEYLRKRVRKCYETMLSEIKTPGVNCRFGSDFARIYWSDSKWVEENLEKIFSKDLWDETWGTYVSWGRPSPKCFELLTENGLYLRAVEKIGTVNKFKFGKEPDKGLVEHLMIGYFNGWIEYDSKELRRFFEKAPAELRGKAARFLTTGFKSVNEEGGDEKEKVASRMRYYWNKRLLAIKEKPKGNEKEAAKLAGWVQNSVLPAKETLELLERSLELSGGKIADLGDVRHFVEAVSNLGQGNELLALRCLQLAASDENMHVSWSGIQEPLVRFLERIVGLREEVRSEGIEVADLYGRYNPDAFREVWEKLKEGE